MAWITASNAESKVTNLWLKMQPFIHALETHPRMNRTAPQSAPKALFFVWDFARRTESMLEQISIPALKAGQTKEREVFSDCVGRNMMLEMMLTTPKGEGMLAGMAGAAGEEVVDFGEGVRSAVREMNKKWEGQ